MLTELGEEEEQGKHRSLINPAYVYLYSESTALYFTVAENSSVELFYHVLQDVLFINKTWQMSNKKCVTV